MDEQMLDAQLEHIYNLSVRTQDVVLRTCRKRWAIERNGERESEKSVQAALHENDDYDDI